MQLNIYIPLNDANFDALSHSNANEKYRIGQPGKEENVYLSEKDALNSYIKSNSNIANDSYDVHIVKFTVDSEEKTPKAQTPYFKPVYHLDEDIPVTGTWLSYLDFQDSSRKPDVSHYHVVKKVSWEPEKSN